MLVCPVCKTAPFPVPWTFLPDGEDADLHRCRCRRLRLSRTCFAFSTRSEGGPQDQVSVNYREATLSRKPIFMRQSGRKYREATEEDVERLVHDAMADEVLGS